MTDIDKLSKRNPFIVPDGYFEDLTANVMKNIDEVTANVHDGDSKRTKVFSLRKRWSWVAAAVACVLIAVLFATMPESTGNTELTAQNSLADSYEEDYEEEMLEYAMVDNSDVYYYLTNNESEK